MTLCRSPKLFSMVIKCVIYTHVQKKNNNTFFFRTSNDLSEALKISGLALLFF